LTRIVPSVLTVVVLGAGITTVSLPAGGQVTVPARDAVPVVLTGNQLPSWSRSPAVGHPKTWPEGTEQLDPIRSAHHGTLTVPPDPRTGVPIDEVAAYSWTGTGWREVPVQVDERYPYFLSNSRSDFAFYSSVDEELTYAWDVESWKKIPGDCSARYPQSIDEVNTLIADGLITLGDGEQAEDYFGPMPDPVAGLDDDDEVVFMASDAGLRAGSAELGPRNTQEGSRQEVALVDPLNPANVRFVYLFRKTGGSSFDTSTGYVDYERDADADEFIDRFSIRRDDPEILGVSNTGYGPNLPGPVCITADYPGYPSPTEPDGTPRESTDRFPRDGLTVSTDAYRWIATGRWMVRDMHVARPGAPGVYGPDLVDRWKGRAFQQSPDSSISLVGFEDEQVNWEANSALLGERTGPVRAIRETWGADSGTNVTKTEYFYRDAVVYRYHIRVHPIPPDGLYTSWDYNAGVATKYFNALIDVKDPDGVDIDGINDDTGNFDGIGDFPAFFDAPDPTHSLPLGTYNWEQVSGAGDFGSLVYLFEVKGATGVENPVVFPYYRDDKCLDDGTGDDPVPRPWPGEPSTDQRVQDGYAAAAGKPYEQVTCDEKQGAWGSHGVHTFFTGDTDNALQSKPATEVDAQQWQFAVPTSSPGSVGSGYHLAVTVPLAAAAVEQDNTPAPKNTTTITYTGDSEGQATDSATLAARLDDDDGGVANADLVFEFQGNQYPRRTDSDGEASVVVTISGPAGDAPIEVSYAGDQDRSGTSTEQTFSVLHEDTAIEFKASAWNPRNKTAAVTAHLSDPDASGISGKTVRFLINGSEFASEETDGEGNASATLTSKPKKNSTIEVVFDGDNTYLGSLAEGDYDSKTGGSGSSDSTPTAVMAAAAGGGFLLLLFLALSVIGRRKPAR
jgi:hypothetical protein